MPIPAPEIIGATAVTVIEHPEVNAFGKTPLVASITNVDVPPPNGVPEITPVEPFSVNPLGKAGVLTLHVIGVVPVAVIVNGPYATP